MESSLGQRLKLLIKEKGLEQQKAALDMGFKASTFSGYVLDKREPTIARLRQLAAYFNTSVDYLVGYTDIRDPYLSHLSPEQKAFITDPENALYIDLAQDIKGKTSGAQHMLKKSAK